jgi:hypothetical protein
MSLQGAHCPKMRHLKIVHYRFYNSSALVPILSQSDSIQTLAHYVFSINFNILILLTCT